MILSTRKRFIFIAVQHTATTSIESCLHQLLDGVTSWQEPWTPWTGSRRRGLEYMMSKLHRKESFINGGHKHASLQRIQEWYGDEIEGYRTAAFVRNPWDRAVSSYFQSRIPVNLHNPQRKFAYELANKLPFHAWVAERWHNCKPSTQHTLVCDANSKVSVEFLGRYENLDDDFRLMCEKFDLGSALLPRLNIHRRKPFQEYYDPDSIKIVRELFAVDIEAFGYSFDD